jgi:hypothetical protein
MMYYYWNVHFQSQRVKQYMVLLKYLFLLFRYVTAFLELVRRNFFVTNGKAFQFTADSRKNLRDYFNWIMEKLREKKGRKRKREKEQRSKIWAGYVPFSNIFVFVDEDSDLLRWSLFSSWVVPDVASKRREALSLQQSATSLVFRNTAVRIPDFSYLWMSGINLCLFDFVHQQISFVLHIVLIQI